MKCRVDLLDPSNADEATQAVLLYQLHPDVRFVCIGESNDSAQSGDMTWELSGSESDVRCALNHLCVDMKFVTIE